MQHIICSFHVPLLCECLMSEHGCKKNQENRLLADLVVSSEVQFAAGDFNFALSTERGSCHDVMAQISTKTDLKYLPALTYHNGKLCQDSQSNVHDRTARHCYDMCLVPDTNVSLSVKFVAVPGDLAYLLALQTVVDQDSNLTKGHVVQYYNQKRFDHWTMVIESW